MVGSETRLCGGASGAPAQPRKVSVLLRERDDLYRHPEVRFAVGRSAHLRIAPSSCGKMARRSVRGPFRQRAAALPGESSNRNNLEVYIFVPSVVPKEYLSFTLPSAAPLSSVVRAAEEALCLPSG